MKVFVTKDKFPDMLKAIRELTKKEVLVGVPDINAGRNDEEPISNAEIGYLMEFGSPSQNIPARPHLIPGIQDAREKIGDDLAKGVNGALSGNMQAGEIALNKAGFDAVRSVKGKINDGLPPPLSPKTIENRFRSRKTKRMRKGEREYLALVGGGMSPAEAQAATGIRPLINTGQYRNAQTYVVRKKGDD